MDFKDVVKKYAQIKARGYAKEELKKNKKDMDIDLYNNCVLELENALLPDLIRIISYEFAKFLDQNELEENAITIEKFCEEILSKKYLNNFDVKFYVFAEVVSEKIKNLANYHREIWRNYNKYRSELENIFFKDYGEILAIECSQGDLHNGKSVATVTFENGTLIYKPRDEKNLEFLIKIVHFLSSECEIRDFNFVDFFSKDDFSFEKMVEQTTCNSLEEIKRYYYRAGVLLSAFYFLSSFDMHHENVISFCEYPVVIDCETIVRCLLNDEVEFEPKDGRISVLSTSFIPFLNDQAVFDVNISALFSEHGESKRKQQILVQDDKNNIFYQDVNIQVPEEKNIVRLQDGSTISDVEARDYLIKGFRCAGTYAIKHKIEFLALINSFFAENKMICRQLLRSTQIYYQFIQASTHPEMLQDEAERNDLLAILTKNFLASKFGFIRVQHEISEMKKGNIPLYYTMIGSSHLFSNNQVICENYFKEAPDVTIIKKVDRFDSELLDYQIKLIQKSVTLVQKEENFGNTIIRKQKRNLGPIDEPYLHNCTKYWADYLKELEYKIGDSSSTLSCLGMSKNKRLFSLDNMNFMLYEHGMFPLYLLYYGEKTSDAVAKECSIRLVETLLQYFMKLKAIKKEKRNYNFSVFTGIGSLMYLSYNFYKVTGDKKYLDTTIEITNFVLEEVIYTEKIKREEYLFLSGICSSVYLATKIYEDSQKTEIKENLVAAIKKLVKDFNMQDYQTVGFAHGLSGIAVEFSEFYKLTGNEELNDIVKNIVEKENQYIENKLWDQQEFYTWCNGKSGVLLARKIIFDNLKKDNELVQDCFKDVFYSWLDEDAFFGINNMCLCHGLYGNIEIAQYLLRSIRNEKVQKKVNRKYFEGFSELEWIKGFDYEFEHFMLGNMGIAYVMLELLYHDIPSVLTLELHK